MAESSDSAGRGLTPPMLPHPSHNEAFLRVRDDRDDLRRRIDRTLAYIEELQPEALSSDARLTLDAVRRSLITPARGQSDG